MAQSGKFDREKAIVMEILAKGENITHEDRMVLLGIYQAPYHKDGKIAGIYSCDSSCHGCEFCQHMREAAENNILHICGYCYDAQQEAYRSGVRNRHELNMVIMASVEFLECELATLPIGAVLRINSSGDAPNVVYANNMRKIAESHPMTHTTIWAKNTAPVIAVFDKYGKPSNMLFIQSSVLIGIPAKRQKYVDYVFTVYPDEDTLQEALRNGAVECNGKKCRDCGMKCYFGTWEKGANIAELLRLPEKKRGAVVAALKEYKAKHGLR